MLHHRRPKVLHILGSLVGGGVQRLILDMAASEELGEYDHAVLPMLGAMGELTGKFENGKIRICSCDLCIPRYRGWAPYRPTKLLRGLLKYTFLFRLRRLVQSCAPDLIHTHLSRYVDWQISAVRHGRGCGWIWTVHGQYEPRGPELARWRRAVNLADKSLFRLVAVSKCVRSELENLNLGVPLEVIHSGVDLKKADGGHTSRSAARKRFGLPEDGAIFGSAGRLVPDKGFDIMVEAAAIVAARFPKAFFVVAGEGGEKDALLRRVAASSLGSRFKFAGFCDDIMSFLGALDAFVMPSRREGLGIALLEALAMGLPCVGSRVGGIEELLQDGLGILAEPTSPHSLAECMVKLLEGGYPVVGNDIIRGRLERYSLEQSLNAYRRLYRELLVAGASSSSSSNRR